MKLEINNYAILKENMDSIKNISYDIENDVYVSELPNLIIDFDLVTKKLLLQSRKSCDGFWCFKKLESSFIEFKNGGFNVEDILDKYNDSVKTMNEILALKNVNYKLVFVYNELFVLKKDSKYNTHIANHVIGRAGIKYSDLYKDRLKKISESIPRALCLNQKDFESFVNREY